MQKAMTATASELFDSLPEAMSRTQRVCGGINVASTRVGIIMDAVRKPVTPSKPWPKPTAPTTASPARS